MTSGQRELFSYLPQANELSESIEKVGYVIYDDVVPLETIDALKEYWRVFFENDWPARKAERGDLRLGECNFNSYDDSSLWCLYRHFDFLWNAPDHELTRDIGVEIHKLRNQAQGFPADYGLSYSSKGYGIYISTSCYPAHTGRLRAHLDGHQDTPILQYMLPITHKGVDYEGGGMFLINSNGQKIDVDSHMRPGSVVFFDARQQHGVDIIKPNPGKSLGRIASFAIPTFFRTQQEIPTIIRKFESVYRSARFRIKKILNKNDGDWYY